MLVQTREQFDEALDNIYAEDIVAVDIESNGLNPYTGDKLIGLSVYLVDADKTYYFPFRHGQGEVEVSYTETNTEQTPYEEMNWQGATKEKLLLRDVQPMLPFEYDNIPEEVMSELSSALYTCDWVMHNARFDMHFLAQEGFSIPTNVIDTMVSLHLVNEDWGGASMEAPFKWSNKDADNGLCEKSDVGMWARDEEGRLMTRERRLNRKLKEQSAALGLPQATEGEEDLRAHRIEVGDKIADYIFDHQDRYPELLEDVSTNPIRCSSAYPKPLYTDNKPVSRAESRMIEDGEVFAVDKNYKHWGQGIWERQGDTFVRVDSLMGLIPVEDEMVERFYAVVADAKVWEAIRKRINISEKSEMWMMPARYVAEYAELDTKLTWELYQWCLPVLKEWDNEELHETQQRVMREVCWVMERNGVKVDIERAMREVEILDSKLEDLNRILKEIAEDFGIEDLNPNSYQQLDEFLSEELMATEFDRNVYPEWFPQKMTETYTGAPEGTAADVLEEFEDHPVVRMIQEQRRMHKSSNTYLKKWINSTDENGRVHFAMNPDGTYSGRLSSGGGYGGGNGQNIPERGGYTIKRAIVPTDSSKIFVAIDYGQLEARIAAWIAEVLLGLGNMEMTNLFNAGVDMHSHVARELDVENVLYGHLKEDGDSKEDWYAKIAYANGLDPDDLDDLEGKVWSDFIRQVAKTCNFGLLYKGTEYMLSKTLKIDLKTAKVLHDRWRDMFPAFAAAQKAFTDLALTPRESPQGNLELVQYTTQPISGRHRKLHNYPTKFYYTNDAGKRKWFNLKVANAEKTWNNSVQGLGGYIATVSALLINERFRNTVVQWFANIHDALDGEFERDSLQVIYDVIEYMTDWDTNPELLVDVEAGFNWQPASNSNPNGMSEVEDLKLWVESQGTRGYKKYDNKEPVV